jgi:DNA-binding response OmpR family regulator
VSKKPLILVVEDDAEMNQLQRELLSLYEMDSAPAYSGVEAVRFCDHQTPDAILLDLMLPELDGFETCVQIRTHRENRHIPIIMLTALDGEDCRRRGLAAGADAYFVKPFDPDDVIRTLQLLLNQAE